MTSQPPGMDDSNLERLRCVSVKYDRQTNTHNTRTNCVHSYMRTYKNVMRAFTYKITKNPASKHIHSYIIYVYIFICVLNAYHSCDVCVCVCARAHAHRHLNNIFTHAPTRAYTNKFIWVNTCEGVVDILLNNSHDYAEAVKRIHAILEDKLTGRNDKLTYRPFNRSCYGALLDLNNTAGMCTLLVCYCINNQLSALLLLLPLYTRTYTHTHTTTSTNAKYTFFSVLHAPDAPLRFCERLGVPACLPWCVCMSQIQSTWCMGS